MGAVRKEYLCLCRGPLLGPVGTKGEVCRKLLLSKGQYRAFVSPKGKEAHTQYTVLDLFEPPGPTSILSADDELGAAIARYVDGVSSMKEPGREGPLLTLLRVHPLTGRTHQ